MTLFKITYSISPIKISIYGYFNFMNEIMKNNMFYPISIPNTCVPPLALTVTGVSNTSRAIRNDTPLLYMIIPTSFTVISSAVPLDTVFVNLPT